MERPRFDIILIVAIFSLELLWSSFRPHSRITSELHEWIVSHHLDGIQEELVLSEIFTATDLARTGQKFSIDKQIFSQLENLVVAQKYFLYHGTYVSLSRLEQLGITSLHEASSLDAQTLPQDLQKVIQGMAKNSVDIDEYTSSVLKELRRKNSYEVDRDVCWFLVAVCFLVGWRLYVRIQGCPKYLFRFLFRKDLDPSRCQTIWHWDDECTVGKTVTFSIQFFQNCGEPYPISDADQFNVKVDKGSNKVPVQSDPGNNFNEIKFSFFPKRAGAYHIYATINGISIEGYPTIRRFLPGPPDISRFTIKPNAYLLVLSSHRTSSIFISSRDEYGNVCSFTDPESEVQKYELRFINADIKTTSEYDSQKQRVQIHLPKLPEDFYKASLEYCGKNILPEEMSILSIHIGDVAKIANFVRYKIMKKIEATILQEQSDGVFTGNPVTCGLTSRQLTFYDSLLWVFHKQVAKFRVSRNTKLKMIKGLVKEKSKTTPSRILVIESPGQKPCYVGGPNVHLIMGAFAEFRLENIGGSETFVDKQNHFYSSLRQRQSQHLFRITLEVSRHDILESSISKTKNLSVVQWKRNMRISFIGEDGLDEGGILREWLDLVSRELFEPDKQLFKGLHDGAQALVHPNPDRNIKHSLKYYRFAGKLLGKCLYECGLSMYPTLLIRASFTRSFLAQILGLPVSYEHFQTDDPEYYRCFVKYILENDVATLDELYFVDNVIKNRKNKVVELVPSGSKKRVTNENKADYLNAIAQFRLSTRVWDEIEAFRSGLYDFVDPLLLDSFNESELELLACGVEDFSISDMKAFAVEEISGPHNERVLRWFWRAVENFTSEEKAKLLQFITGSSRLPALGFSDMLPRIRIQIEAGSFGKLPSAHTCANLMTLSDHETFEKFEESLLYAIREGHEGFGFY